MSLSISRAYLILLSLAASLVLLTGCSAVSNSLSSITQISDSQKVKTGAKDKIVIAHRGASGYLPEHTMEAKVLAFAQGADFIEQDVVVTKDKQLVVLHDLTLDNTTDVVTQFPGRARADGRFYVIDFTLAELRTLRVSERFNSSGTNTRAEYPNRFPINQGRFQIHTFEEEVALIQNLNRLLGKNVGIYPEIKSPAFHKNEGVDISLMVLEALKKLGYQNKSSRVYLQSFDPNALQRIKNELMPRLNMNIKLVQLMAYSKWNVSYEYKNNQKKPYNYDWMFSKQGLSKIAKYADGVGPHLSMLVESGSRLGAVTPTSLVEDAHQLGLAVHPYTFRADPEKLPKYVSNFDELLSLFLFDLGVDGVFTDFPDRALGVIQHK